jgi:hypothetical protein
MHHNNNLIFENLAVYNNLVFSMTILTDKDDPTLDIEKPLTEQYVRFKKFKRGCSTPGSK